MRCRLVAAAYSPIAGRIGAAEGFDPSNSPRASSKASGPSIALTVLSAFTMMYVVAMITMIFPFGFLARKASANSRAE